MCSKLTTTLGLAMAYNLLFKLKLVILSLTTLVTLLFCVPLALADHSEGEDPNYHIYLEVERMPMAISVYANSELFVALESQKDNQARVMHVNRTKNMKPFPNEKWAYAPNENGEGLQQVSSIRASLDGIIWMLDNGSFPKRLIGWNFDQDELYKVIEINPLLVTQSSNLVDMALDTVNYAMIIADPAGDVPALVTVDLNTGKARRVLQGHASVIPDLQDASVDLDSLMGVRSITIDTESDFVYFAPQSSKKLFRVLSTDLLDEDLSQEDLSSKVQEYAQKPISAGISIDTMGTLYLTDIENNAIGIITLSTKRFRKVNVDDDHANALNSPNSLSVGTASYMYVSNMKTGKSRYILEHDDNHEHEHQGEVKGQNKYQILRFIARGPLMGGR